MKGSVLVAGIGNIFLGDDAFGVEVAQRLRAENLPPGVRVIDFGIRGFDLAYAFLDGYEAIVLVDATQRSGEPGTLYVIEPELEEIEAEAAREIDTHAMHPGAVFRLVKAMGGEFPKVVVVGCEPQWLGDPDEGGMGLSDPVRAAVQEAATCIRKLVKELMAKESGYEMLRK